MDDQRKQPYKHRIKRSYYTTQEGKILKIESSEEKSIRGDADRSEVEITKESEISFPCESCSSKISSFDHINLMHKRLCQLCGKELARKIILQSIQSPESVKIEDLLSAEMILAKKS